MRIGLDGMPLTELKTGIGTYTSELARALAAQAPDDDFELISPRPFQPAAMSDAKPANLSLVYAKPNPLQRRWWTFGLPSYVRRTSLDLFHGTNFEVPLRGNCPTVVTIHDLSLLLHSSTHATRAVLRGRLRLPRMARRATLVITVSEPVRREVCERLRIDGDRVFAIPLAPRSGFTAVAPDVALEVRKRLGVEDEFLLFAGTIEPRKNLITLVRAFEEVLRTTELRPQLVLAGKIGWKTSDLLTQLERTDRIKLIGYTPDADLRALYSSCRAFIYPSVYEGFGLPPLEAMACGAPVIASAVPSVNPNVARVIAPTDVHGLARNIVELLTDANARESLSRAGLKHAAQFSWERTAKLTREVYDQALKKQTGQLQ
ncbi:MAG TPA: glycosyltransferase family 1 protein [Pyrinomonadaceae bacterium]|nr:glycosyltransferase family 1 protein [Pyrinomonadaceae bacterium]